MSNTPTPRAQQAPLPQRARMVGARAPLIDGVEKVTGRALYTADFAHHDALVGRIYRSPYSHAEILSLDVSAAAVIGTLDWLP